MENRRDTRYERPCGIYTELKEQREPRLREFLTSSAPGFLIMQNPPVKLRKQCNEVHTIIDHNLVSVREHMDNPWTDDLPFFEPWIGT